MSYIHWNKLGLIIRPLAGSNWHHSHCQLPVADPQGDDVFRVYYAARNTENISQVGYCDVYVDAEKMSCEIIYQTPAPVLCPGNIGTFDQFGVFPASLVNVGNEKYLYYVGWVRGYTAPLFYASIGLAVSTDNGVSFSKHLDVPVMDRGQFDPCLVTSPNIFIEGDTWRMTYVSGVEWKLMDGKLQSRYHIKYADSENGLDWKREGVVAIDFASPSETNIARSSVIRENGIYKMWYGYVSEGKGYRLGYAESPDCIHWNRMDHLAEAGLKINDYDADMRCYPNVLLHKGRKLMFYNGNSYGREGVCLAIED